MMLRTNISLKVVIVIKLFISFKKKQIKKVLQKKVICYLLFVSCIVHLMLIVAVVTLIILKLSLKD